MKRENITIDKCPSNNDYQNYLSGNTSDDFIYQFENHLKQCDLCKEAMEGYKATSLLYKDNTFITSATKSSPELKKINFRKWVSYAAALAILFSISFFLVNQNFNVNKQYVAEANTSIKLNSNKKLMHKSSTEYWYVGNNKTIAVNDKLISKDELKKAMATTNSKSQVIVQIENQEKKVADEIISSIKQNKNIPVYTISKQKGLKTD